MGLVTRVFVLTRWGSNPQDSTSCCKPRGGAMPRILKYVAIGGQPAQICALDAHRSELGIFLLSREQLRLRQQLRLALGPVMVWPRLDIDMLNVCWGMIDPSTCLVLWIMIHLSLRIVTG